MSVNRSLRLTFTIFYIIKIIIKIIRKIIMGAVAVSKEDEQQIQRLCKELGIPTKAGLIRAALQTLEKQTNEERLRREIEESVRRCAAADKEENQELFPAGIARRIPGD